MVREGLFLLVGGSPGGHRAMLYSVMAMSRMAFDGMAGSADGCDGGGGEGDRVDVLV